METIEVEVRVNQKVDAHVELYLVIDSLNELPMTKRWNYLAQILNAIKLDDKELTDEQKRIVKRFLLKKLEPLKAVEV